MGTRGHGLLGHGLRWVRDGPWAMGHGPWAMGPDGRQAPRGRHLRRIVMPVCCGPQGMGTTMKSASMKSASMKSARSGHIVKSARNGHNDGCRACNRLGRRCSLIPLGCNLIPQMQICALGPMLRTSHSTSTSWPMLRTSPHILMLSSWARHGGVWLPWGGNGPSPPPSAVKPPAPVKASVGSPRR